MHMKIKVYIICAFNTMSINNHNNIIYFNRLGERIPTLKTKFLGTIVSQKKSLSKSGRPREPVSTAANSTSSTTDYRRRASVRTNTSLWSSPYARYPRSLDLLSRTTIAQLTLLYSTEAVYLVIKMWGLYDIMFPIYSLIR